MPTVSGNAVTCWYRWKLITCTTTFKNLNLTVCNIELHAPPILWKAGIGAGGGKLPQAPMQYISLTACKGIITSVKAAWSASQHRCNHLRTCQKYQQPIFQAMKGSRTACPTRKRKFGTRRLSAHSSLFARWVAEVAHCCAQKLMGSAIFFIAIWHGSKVLRQQYSAVHKTCWLK